MAYAKILALSVLTLGASVAMAAPKKGQVSLRLMGGMDFPVGGRLHDGASANVPNLGALNPALAGVPGTLNFEPRGNQRFWNGGFGGNVELGYGLSDNSELFGAFRYQHNKAGANVIGNVAAAGTSFDTFGNFSNLRAFSGEVGYRRYFGTFVKPYVAARAGITFTESVQASVTVPGAAVALNNLPFYRNSVSATGGLDAGVAIPLSPSIDFNIETGIRYTTGLRGDDSVIGGLGLGALNDAGARWDVPVRAGVTFAF